MKNIATAMSGQKPWQLVQAFKLGVLAQMVFHKKSSMETTLLFTPFERTVKVISNKCLAVGLNAG